MKKIIIIFILLIALLLISACEEKIDSQMPVKSETETKIEVEQESVEEAKEIETAKQIETPKPVEKKPEEQKQTSKDILENEIEIVDDADFSDYPEILLNGKNPSYKIIIGMDGPSTDVIAAIDITTSITAALNAETDEALSVMDVKVSSLKTNNYIIVGSPCWNRKTAEVLGLNYPACSNTGITGPELRILKNGEYHIVLVTGNSAEDIRTSAKYLAQNKKLSGSVVKIN